MTPVNVYLSVGSLAGAAMPRSETADRILDAAEARVRCSGFNGFSFRDVAEDIGIKSASVHYHFPDKAALGEALALRYADRFMEALGDPGDGSPESRFAHYRGLFRKALVKDGLMCLCGMLGAETAGLPEPVAHATAAFFRRNIAWLVAVLARAGVPEAERESRAARMIALLEGAMILARSLGDPTLFDRIVDGPA